MTVTPLYGRARFCRGQVKNQYEFSRFTESTVRHVSTCIEHFLLLLFGCTMSAVCTVMANLCANDLYVPWMNETPFKIWLYYGSLCQYMKLMWNSVNARSDWKPVPFMITTFQFSSGFNSPLISSLFFPLHFSIYVFPVHLQVRPLVRNMQINLLISCIESLRLSWNTCLAAIPAY